MSGRVFSFDKYAMQPQKSTAAKNTVSSSSSSKRVIQCSDDEYESDVEVLKGARKTATPGTNGSDDGWKESRDSTMMSTSEKAKNIKRAQQERNPNKITKRPRIIDDGDDCDRSIGGESDRDEDQIESHRKIDYSIKINSALDSSLLEDTPEPKSASALDVDREAVLKRERDYRSSKRSDAAHGSTDIISKKEKKQVEVMINLSADDGEEAAADDDSDNEDGGGGGWNDTDDKSEVKEKAMSVLKYCEMIGTTLRSNLDSWGGDDAKDTDDAKNTQKGNFCTGIMSIKKKKGKGSDSSDILGDDYFKDVCPGLILKGYQLVGVNWLKLLHENNVNGVLADDMGLGKTVQSIAFIAWLKTSSTVDPDNQSAHLIVVPASTLANWENELRRFCPSLNVVSYHGSQNERAELRHDLKRDIRAGRVDVVLSTFTIFERESGKDDRSFLYKQNFEYLIVDEAHCLKVSKSARFQNMNALKAKHRLLLSGTPVQNDLGELLSLMSFTMPKLFRNIDVEDVLEGFGWDKRSGVPSSSSSSVSINQLRGMLAPFVLRRIKSDVLDQLVEKESFLEKVQMTTFQSKVYDNILYGHAQRKENMKQQVASEILSESFLSGVVKTKKPKITARQKELLDLTSSPAPAPKKGKKGEIESTETDTMVVSLVENTLDVLANVKAEDAEKIVHALSSSEAANLFTALRKAANHPLLLRVRYQDDVVMKKIAEVTYAEGRFGYQCDLKRVRDEIDKFSDFDLHQLCLEYPGPLGSLQLDATALYDSQKMQKLKEMLPRLASEGHRILVFSQWTRLLDLLEVLLYDIDMKFLRLDGSTPVKDRQELIDEYSAVGSDIPVFLLSTKAGGLGINLTAADTVIMHDLDFNPENDRQAEDRCHRIGQTRAVRVYRLVTADTVDEDIYEMGERKRKLTAAVLSDHHGQKKGKKSKEGLEGEDIGAIGRILQKALQKRTSQKLGGDVGTAGAVKVIESVIHVPISSTA